MITKRKPIHREVLEQAAGTGSSLQTADQEGPAEPDLAIRFQGPELDAITTQSVTDIGEDMDIPDISDASFANGVARISELTGLATDDSEALLLAYLQGAVDLALDQVAGDGPVPTSLNVLRADLFRWTCTRANRIPPEREVEVLLRIPGSTARSVLRTMRAMYEEALRELFLQRMRLDAAVRPSGNDDEGLTWTLEFTESALFDLALSEIRRLPIPRRLIQTVVSRSRIEIPRQAEVEGDMLDVLEALGIDAPLDE